MEPTIQQLKKVLEKQNIPPYAIHDDKQICGFFGQFRFLSNFWYCPNKINYLGISYPTTEHVFQAMKWTEERRSEVLKMTCSEVKKFGKQAVLPTDWDDTKNTLMEELVKIKFTTDNKLKKMLLNTGNKYLEERNHWGDMWWGTNEKGVGENNLGKILMKVRTML